MADPLWYYGQDGRECGPVSLARLIELIGAGTVRPTDLVWCEGMQDWAPAARVKALSAATASVEKPVARPPARPTTVEEGPPRPPLRPGIFGAVRGLVRPGPLAAKSLLILGIVLVLCARGCDALGERNVVRLGAQQAAARQQFDDTWENKRIRGQQSIDRLTEGKTNTTPEERKEIDRLKADLADLAKQQTAARKQMVEGEWRDQEIVARNAKWNNAMWAYWRELLFVVGTLIFTVGLILTGFGGQGAERWIALSMLAIVVFSIYIGGTAWSAALRAVVP